jgi:hypothetical protein
LSGFVSSGFSVGAGAGYKGAFAMAIIGGTTSELGGGKFSNGAMGSAFQYMFNDMANASLNKAFKSLTDGLYGLGDYMARISGFRDWNEGLAIDSNYYQNQALFETHAAITFGEHILSNPTLTMDAVKIYANYNSGQMEANSLVNFGVGLAVPGVGIAAFIGNTMHGAHKINSIYESIKD